jgi:hypothetical protein
MQVFVPGTQLYNLYAKLGAYRQIFRHAWDNHLGLFCMANERSFLRLAPAGPLLFGDWDVCHVVGVHLDVQNGLCG